MNTVENYQFVEVFPQVSLSMCLWQQGVGDLTDRQKAIVSVVI